MTFPQLIHKLNGRCMARPCLEKGINLIKHIVRCVKDRLMLFKLFVDRFCLLIMFVFGNSEGTEGAGIDKDLQSKASPYRYLS